MSIDFDRSILENVKNVKGGITARCPACAINGRDKKGQHLFIGDTGFSCVVHIGDSAHNALIAKILKVTNAPSHGEDSNVLVREKNIEVAKTWPFDLLKKLLPHDEYWNKRGITSETLRIFNAGFSPKGDFQISGRYVFPIFSKQGTIIGWSGRAIHDDAEIKWKHIGKKTDWVFPILSDEHIKLKKYVVLVEGISDVIWLYQCGIKNVLACFGLSIGSGLLRYLISLGKIKIVIATNNEPDNNNIGNIAAEKIRENLLHYFSSTNLFIKLPPKKDFGCLSEKETHSFFQELEEEILQK